MPLILALVIAYIQRTLFWKRSEMHLIMKDNVKVVHGSSEMSSSQLKIIRNGQNKLRKIDGLKRVAHGLKREEFTAKNPIHG